MCIRDRGIAELASDQLRKETDCGELFGSVQSESSTALENPDGIKKKGWPAAPSFQNCKFISRILFQCSSFISTFRHRNALSAYPPRSGGLPSIRGLHGLSAPEVYLAAHVTMHTGGLLPHLFTLTAPLRRGGLLSAALAVFRLLGILPVRKQAALCCPDFPHNAKGVTR